MKLFGRTRVLGGVKSVDGYTIIEVMIFLVVSAGLLIAVLGLISGQQQRTRFITGVNDFDSQIQDMINDVEVGYYPAETIESAGTNSGRIFLGKAIQFHRNTATNEVSVYREMTIEGDATIGTPPRDVSSLSEANPRALAGVESEHQLVNGVELTSIRYGESGDISHGFAIVSGISSDGKKSSGSRGLLARIDINTEGSLPAVIGSLGTGDPVGDASGGMIFCLREGGGGRVAAVALGMALESGSAVSTGQRNTTNIYYADEAEQLGCTG
ncbi:MAG: hypothetical protein AAB423_03940 [Patescibacteria group bacterium]